MRARLQGLILAAGSVKYHSIRKEAISRNILINLTLRNKLIYTNIILSKALILLDVDFSVLVPGHNSEHTIGIRDIIKLSINKDLKLEKEKEKNSSAA